MKKEPKGFLKNPNFDKYLLALMEKIIRYIREAHAELLRVTWPTRSQTINYTILVVVISLCVAAFLGALDYLFGWGVKNHLVEQAEIPSIEQTLEVDPQIVEVESGETTVEGVLDAENGVIVDTEGVEVSAQEVAPEAQEAQAVTEGADVQNQ